jgi:hypothetical protein
LSFGSLQLLEGKRREGLEARKPFPQKPVEITRPTQETKDEEPQPQPQP